MIRRKTFPYELIGEEVEVVKSNNKSSLGIKGKVVDETKQTIKIEMLGKTKTLLKKNITFKLKKSGRIVDGKKLTKRPEERIKC